MHPSIFTDQSIVDRAVNDICILFEYSRHDLNVGKGYPDIPTRRFLRLLVDELHIPVYCLVDSDPYGFDILTTYRLGSKQLAYDAKFLRIPEIVWIGPFASDTDKYSLPSQCLLPLTTEDKQKAKALLQRCYLQREEAQWRLELELMLLKGVKFEIEALSANSLSFLSEEYLPSMIQEHRTKGLCFTST